MAEKILFVDAQVFQGNDWNRGMGRYSFDLLKSMINRPEFDYAKTYLVFTERILLSPGVQKELERALPGVEKLFLDLEVPTDSILSGLPNKSSHNKRVLNRYLSKIGSQKEIDFLILALFTDYTCSVYPSRARKILVGYDLIPLLYSKHYRKFPTFSAYLERYSVIFDADIIFTISQTTADDFAMYLGINGRKIYNIKGASITRNNDMPAAYPGLPAKAKFYLMPSGDEFRKNNLNAVKGFAAYLEKSKDEETELVITSNFTEGTRKELLTACPRIRFVGKVSEQEMQLLYKKAEGVLFVPEYEGLGLPILEAVEADKPVVCSDISVFREISEDAFYFVDQTDPMNIASGLIAAQDTHKWHQKQKNYLKIQNDFSWDQTAQQALYALNNKSNQVMTVKKKRLAVFCPDPEGYSEIGRMTMQLHACLSDKFEVDYYIEKTDLPEERKLRPNYLPKVARVFGANEFNQYKYKKYEAVIYHIGNSEYHVEIIKNALYLPGIAIFHDTNLEDVFLGPLQQQGYITMDRVHAENLLNRFNRSHKSKFLTSLANAQRANLVHSEYAHEALKTLSRHVPTHAVNLPNTAPTFRKKLPKGKINIGIAGNLHPSKGIRFIEELAATEEIASKCNLYLFGFLALEEEYVEKLKQHLNITIKIDLSDLEFQTALSKLDLLVNYRADYRGESSSTVVSAMRYGVVPLVRNVGWYGELPNECVIKINKEEELIDAIKQAVEEPGILFKRAQNCYTHIKQHHSLNVYVDAIENIINNFYTDSEGGNEKLARLLKGRHTNRQVEAIIKNIEI